MAQRRHHYERAFESYLRARRIPYICVDEARKTLLPESAAHAQRSLKSFDFVLSTPDRNLLVDVKGRRAPSLRRAARPMRLESWVTEEDVADLTHWRSLFGPAFDAAFVFLYECAEQPPDALFEEVFSERDRWYALRVIRLADYAAHSTPRSSRWRTVHLSASDFEQFSGPMHSSRPRPARSPVEARSQRPALLSRPAPRIVLP